MGRVIIKQRIGSSIKLLSLKCKSKERAEEIVLKRNNVLEWNYYDDNQRVPQPKKHANSYYKPTSLEELEVELRKQGVI